MAPVNRLGIAPTKLFDYLLNIDHPEGGSKARFFLARGFTRDRHEELGTALVWHAMRDWPGDMLSTAHATKFRITGPILCPDDSTPEILTVRQAAHGDTTAMLVTARPSRPRGR